jgi:hypothetical protein
VTLAQVTGAPVLPAFLYRSADYRTQVLEISPPLPMSGDIATAFGRCTAEVNAAILRSPAQWRYWASTADLMKLGLTSPAGGLRISARTRVNLCGPGARGLTERRRARIRRLRDASTGREHQIR